MNGQQDLGLFRDQVVQRRRQRLYGDVILSGDRRGTVAVVTVSALSIAMVLWAVAASYPRTVQVKGYVSSSESAAKVMAPRQGIVEQLLVSDGAKVRRGEALAYISVDLEGRKSRRIGRDTLSALIAQRNAVGSQLQDEIQTTRDEGVHLTAAGKTAASEIAALQEQVRIQANLIASSAATIERLRPILAKGFVSQLEMDRREQALLMQKQQAAQLQQQLAQANARDEDIKSRYKQLPVDLHRRTSSIEEKLQTIAFQQSRAESDVGYVVTAPISGEITSLQTAEGRMVESRVPIMTVLPARTSFEVELLAPSRAIGFIKSGQKVRIMYDAFPYKQFGTFEGTVIGVSRTAFTPAELDAPARPEEAVYRVRVAIRDPFVKAYGRAFSLQLGMSLDATILLERRSFLDWLLEPLNAVRRRS